MVGPGRTDEELLAAYATGGAVADEAFAQIVRRHGGLVYQTCLRVVGRWVTAQDAAQATFVVLARRAGAVRSNVTGFLHSVAVRVARRADRDDRIRHTRDREAGLARMHEASGRRSTRDWVDQISPRMDAEIERLPRMQRAAVLLRYSENRSQADIATELGIARGTVDTHLRRAVETLRRRLVRHARGLTASVLVSLLSPRPAEASCPMFLSEAARGLAGAATAAVAAAPLVGIAPHVVTLGREAIRMMFWAKVKAAAAMLVVAAAVGTGVPAAIQVSWSHGYGAEPYRGEQTDTRRLADSLPDGRVGATEDGGRMNAASQPVTPVVVTVHLSAAKARYALGEPIHLVVELRNPTTQPATVDEVAMRNLVCVDVFADRQHTPLPRGGNAAFYDALEVQTGQLPIQPTPATTVVSPGGSHRETLWAVNRDAYDDENLHVTNPRPLALDTPGVYRVRARAGGVPSNLLKIEVLAEKYAWPKPAEPLPPG